MDEQPKFLCWYGEVRRCLHSEDLCGSLVEKVDKQPCYYLQFAKRSADITYQFNHPYNGDKFLRKLLGDGLVRCEKSVEATDELNLYEQDGEEQFIVQIGPKLRHQTPWCTNVLSAVKSSNIPLARIERTWYYRFTLKPTSNFATVRREIIERCHDPVLEQVYDGPITTFYDELDPLPTTWEEVPLFHGDMELLRKVNEENSFGFDEMDLEYYYKLFKKDMERNPTLVELCDLAQSNSEHSRHSFFKGIYTINGQKLEHSLMEMVMATNGDTTKQNNVIKFHDNSSAISGFAVYNVVASDPTTSSRFDLRRSVKHLLLTAETHNFPTGVAPFSGAATGAGGRIRDVMAAGRGGTTVAATAGYCVGQLHIEGYPMPWECSQNYEGSFEKPLKIIIEASNGASDYGNKFGEPVIGGFFRSYGGKLGTERREWLKPIMFSAGIGMLEEIHVDKVNVQTCTEDMIIAKIGGPAYRIGIGGGAASSVHVQGASDSRTMNAVQRGDPEMGNKLNRFVRACIELNKENPILSIHDQGAGGNANVLKEIVCERGADIYAESFTLGDKSLTLQELWCAEYQESNAIVYKRSDLEVLQKISERERCKIDNVGNFRMDTFFRFHPRNGISLDGPVPVNFDFKHLRTMPRKTYTWVERKEESEPLEISGSPETTLKEAMQRVLKLPSVASKRFLVTKVDRSVTGLVAQQQCVGQYQLPLADVSVTSCSYFSKEGIATSIGEQPIITLVNPAAGARMSLMEALASIVMAPISCLKEVKCSVNWMWPAKFEGEGNQIHEACAALCELMKLLGVAVDGGKDSLSMAAMTMLPNNKTDKLVKAPGTVVVSAYAPCTDINMVVTPDLKGPRRKLPTRLIWVRPVKQLRARLGGSALAQTYGVLGKDTPDVSVADAVVFVKAFAAMQKLIKEKIILACHDVSEGGLIICLVEMAMAGGCGVDVKIPENEYQDATFFEGEDQAPIELATLFSEEIGWLLEVGEGNVEIVLSALKGAHCFDIGTPVGNGNNPEVLVAGPSGNLWIRTPLTELRQSWEETSYRLELFQTTHSCATEEYDSFKKISKPEEYVCKFVYEYGSSPEEIVNLQIKDTVSVDRPPFSHPRVAVLREEGTNGDREMAAAFMMAGFLVYDVTMTDLYNSTLNLNDYDGIAFPGGFSYADSLGAAVGWVASIRGSQWASDMLHDWRDRQNTFSLGVCNGCQLTSLLGWQNFDRDERDRENELKPTHRFLTNSSGRFESRWSRVKIEKTNSIFLDKMEGSVLGVWVAHKEGRFSCEKSSRDVYEHKNMIALRYVNDQNEPTEKYPMNPNGSQGGVAGVVSKCGRHLALMPHPERCVLPWQWPDQGADPEELKFNKRHVEKTPSAPWAKLFQNAYDWCKKQPKFEN